MSEAQPTTTYEAVPPTYQGHTASPAEIGLALNGRAVEEGDTILANPTDGTSFVVKPDELTAQFRQPTTSADHARLESRVSDLEARSNSVSGTITVDQAAFDEAAAAERAKQDRRAQLQAELAKLDQ